MNPGTNVYIKNARIHGNHNVMGMKVSPRAPEPVDEGQQMRAWIRKYEQAGNLERYPEEHFAPNLRNRVMQDSSFARCVTQQGQTVVLIGKAGVGKTTTVEGIVGSLKMKGRQDKVVLGVVYYSRLEAADAHHPSKVMMTLLGQIVDQVPVWTKHVRALWQKVKPGIPAAEQTAAVLETILAGVSRSCIFIDAVDECKDREDVAKVLRSLKRIQDKIKLGIFLTDRLPEEAVWRPSFSSPKEIPVNRAEDADVAWYIKARLMSSSMHYLLEDNASLLEDIRSVVSQASDGIFALVHRHVEYIVSQLPKQSRAKEAQVRNDLARIEVDAKSRVELSKVFNRDLERIISENSETRERELARRVFSFVRDAPPERPFKRTELEALTAWDCNTRTLRPDQSRNWHEIRRICLGLIEIDEFEYVQYGHPTWYMSSGDEETRKKLPNSHAELGRICVQYLSQGIFSSGAFANSGRREERFNDYPLLPYASKYWAWHFNSSQRTQLDSEHYEFEEDALKFLRSDSHVEFSLQMARRLDPLLVDWWETIRIFQRAKTDAAMFHEQPVARMAVGLFDQLQGDIEESEDLDPFFPCRTTGMHWACRQGLDTLVWRLLYPNSQSEEKAFDCKDKQQRTPLHVAASFKHSKIVKMLLERGAHPDPRDKFGYSPLMSASQNGAVDIVRDLLRYREVAINAQTTPPCSIYNRSALHIAAAQGHVDVAKELFLHPHIKVNLRDSHGNTPLHLATKMGNREMIKFFLTSDKPFKIDSRVRCHSIEDASPWCRFCGCTSLHLASLNKRSTDIVQDFLSRYKDKSLGDVVDDYQRTPLHCAARMEAVENVKYLLDHDPQQVNAVDMSGWPPLAEAIKSRNVEICRLLWERPEFDRTIQSKKGVTLLEWAKTCGNGEISAMIRGETYMDSRKGSLDDSKSPDIEPLQDGDLSRQQSASSTFSGAEPRSPRMPPLNSSAVNSAARLVTSGRGPSPGGLASSPREAPMAVSPTVGATNSSPIEILSTHRRSSSGNHASFRLDANPESNTILSATGSPSRRSTLDLSTSTRSSQAVPPTRIRQGSLQTHRSSSRDM